jgi:hypothetical protein
MTRDELHDSIVRCITLSDPPYPTVKIAKLVEEIWGQPFDGETEETTQKDEAEKHETADEKVAWLTEILVTKANDPVFTGYWLRLARRNLQLGLPLKTEEPELTPTQPQ